MNLSGFYVPWAAALVIAGAQPAAAPAATGTMIHFQGLTLPVLQSVLAIAGVLMARPLARKNEATLPTVQFVIVSIIMLVVALAWVAAMQPNVLFTFVVAIGLGFSGYSLVQTAGDEIKQFMTNIISTVTGVLGSIGVKK